MKSSRPTASTNLQPATLRDLGQVYQLQRHVFPVDAYPYLDMALLFLLPGMVNLKAISPDGEVAGYICGAKAWLPGRPAWIVMIGVAQAWRQHGYGAALLEACETQLGASQVRLTVRASNTAAIRLYEHTGYQQISVRRRYYRGGEDGLLMEKQVYSTR